MYFISDCPRVESSAIIHVVPTCILINPGIAIVWPVGAKVFTSSSTNNKLKMDGLWYI